MSGGLAEFLHSLIDHIMQQPRANRRLSLPIIRGEDPLLANKLQPFCIGGTWGDLFDMPEDDFKPGALSCWNLQRWMAEPATRIPLANYLIQRLTMALDGKPTLIVLDEGFTLLDTPLFGPRAAELYDFFTNANAATILTTHHVQASSSYSFTPALSSKTATIFAMADRAPDAGYAMGFGFTPQDMSTLAYIDGRTHQILQKRGSESVVLKMNLSALGTPMLNTLSGRVAQSPADQLADLMNPKKHVV